MYKRMRCTAYNNLQSIELTQQLSQIQLSYYHLYPFDQFFENALLKLTEDVG